MDHSHPSTRAYVSLRCSMIVMTKGNRGSSGSQMPRQFAAVESRHMAQRNRCLIGHHHSFTYTRHTNARDRTLARSLARLHKRIRTHRFITYPAAPYQPSTLAPGLMCPFIGSIPRQHLVRMHARRSMMNCVTIPFVAKKIIRSWE